MSFMWVLAFVVKPTSKLMFGNNDEEDKMPADGYVVENPTKIIVEERIIPTCPMCRFELEAVRYLDYGDIRVVYHTSGKCVIGVMQN